MQNHRRLVGNRRRRLAWHDLGAAAADLPLIGGDQRHVGVHPHPADFGEYLNVEMNVVRGAVLVVAPGRDPAHDLTLAHLPAVEPSVRVQGVRIHV